MTIEEYYDLPPGKRREVAKKITRSTIMSYSEVRRRLSSARAMFATHAYELPIEAAQILVKLDRIKEI